MEGIDVWVKNGDLCPAQGSGLWERQDAAGWQSLGFEKLQDQDLGVWKVQSGVPAELLELASGPQAYTEA